jgi:8-oxo-dGTP diphosphatase
MNPFESGARKNIPAVLIYARSGDQVLMIHRDASERAQADYHAGKWNGLGGKSELDESALETCAREFHEEAGLSLGVDRFSMLGVLQFPNFKAHKNEDWTVFVFSVELSAEESSKVLGSSSEGSLHWVPSKDLLKLNLWPGDQHFIPFVVAQKSFSGAIWYQGKDVSRAVVSVIDSRR